MTLYEDAGNPPRLIKKNIDASYGTDIPIDTIKNWLRGRQRGFEHPPYLEGWDFDKATLEERRLVAPVFATYATRDRDKPLEAWPAQLAADWVVRLRRLHDDEDFAEVYRLARRLAGIDFAIEEGSASTDDRVERAAIIADWLAKAGEQQLRERGRDDGEQ